VNAADYVGWRKADINGQQGYGDWRANFGNVAPSMGPTLKGAQLAAVPEPNTVVTFIVGIALSIGSRRRSRHDAGQERMK
jgi:hypothetical protein